MKPSPRGQKPAGFRWDHVALLILLLAIPGYAVSQFARSIDWRILAGVPVAMSVFSFLACRNDKKRAEAGEWRIPESTLHLLELLGGWPGSFLVQRQYRHKTSKSSYQFLFWLIVLAYEFFALDSLLGWKFTKEFVEFMGRHGRH
jgi:uncharacterized membrane protein YsdA (DUF1294 family)